jgi:hypothetical protein
VNAPVLPFAVSISVLSLTQALVVALPRADPFPILGRLRARGWAAVPALSLVVVVLAVGAASTVAQGLTYLALCAVPPLAVVALGWVVPGARPALAAAVGLLFGLAWLEHHALSGEVAALVLSGLSCVTLGVVLAALAPPRALKAGIPLMAAVDTALVISNLLHAPNQVLNAAHPVAGLPQLQRVVFGSAVMGYGDLFVAGLLGALLATRPSLQRRGALLTAALALTMDLLFLVVRELPATVPVAVTLIVLEAVQRRRPRRSIALRPRVLPAGDQPPGGR